MIPGSRALGTPSTRTSQAGEEIQREFPMGPWFLFHLGAQKKTEVRWGLFFWGNERSKGAKFGESKKNFLCTAGFREMNVRQMGVSFV